MKQKIVDALWDIVSGIGPKNWVVYDPQDMIILFQGTRMECIKVQEQNYGGLVVIKVNSLTKN